MIPTHIEQQRRARTDEPDEARQRTHQLLLTEAGRLSDADLLRRVATLAGRERAATVELIAHLAELDTRKLYRGEGYGSLFVYCTDALGLSEHAAYVRIEAARASREFPELLDLLAEGSLNLSTVRLLVPHLRPETFDALVAAASGKSKREVEALVAGLAPRPDVPSSIRELPGPAPLTAAASTGGAPAVDAAELVATPTLPGPTEPSPLLCGVGRALQSAPQRGTGVTQLATQSGTVSGARAHRPTVTPLAPARYRVQFTVSEAAHQKLRQAQELLRREIPDGDPAAIFDRALTLLLEDVARKKLALTPNPRASVVAGTRTRHVPAAVRRAVWLRDGGQCAFVAANGRRCTERTFLEFHHLDPYAVGGEATVAGISLRCRAHNVYEAELDFGPSAILTRRTSAPAPTPPAPAQSVTRRAQSEAERSPGAANSPRGELNPFRRGASRPSAHGLASARELA